MRRIVWQAMTVVVAGALVTAQSPDDGEISGRIIDSVGGVLPGVTVTVIDGNERRTVFTDSAGEFRVGTLKPGSYNVSADLQSFVSVSSAVTLTSAVRRAYLQWTLRLGCISEIVHVVLNARTAAPLAEGIAHVRIRSAGEPMLVSSRPECPAEEVESYPVEIMRLEFVVGSASDRPAASEILTVPFVSSLAAGGEYLVMLGGGGRVSGAMVALPVQSGRIAASTESTLNGMTVNDAVNTMLAWARQTRSLDVERRP
jgi:hypothetical protein